MTEQGTDYKAQIDEARRAQAAVYLAAHEDVASDISRIIKDLADAVEALLGENDKLRDAFTLMRNSADRRAAERDALQAQLDNMTTETRLRRLTVDGRGKIIYGQLISEQRLVGPWVEVTD